MEQLNLVRYVDKNGYSNEVVGKAVVGEWITEIHRAEGEIIEIPSARFKGQKKVRILHLILKKKWFELILHGFKEHEYREIKPYWDKRLSKKYDYVIFQHGYQKDARKMRAAITNIRKGMPKPEWTYAPDQECYIIEFDTLIKLNFE